MIDELKREYENDGGIKLMKGYSPGGAYFNNSELYYSYFAEWLSKKLLAEREKLQQALADKERG